MNKALPPINESTSELEDRLRHENQPQRKERLLLLYLLKTAQARSRKAAATTIGRSRNTVARWLDLYEADGLEALLAVYEPTGQSGQRTLPREVFEALQAKLSDPEGFGGYLVLQGWLLAEHNMEINYFTLRKMVRRELGAKLKVPRPQHVKKTSPRRLPSPSS